MDEDITLLLAETMGIYQTQLRLLNDLEEAIAEDGPVVTKEYVKGRPNLVANPAIAEYNRTATAANHTIKTIIRLLEVLKAGEEGQTKLKEFIESIETEDNYGKEN